MTFIRDNIRKTFFVFVILILSFSTSLTAYAQGVDDMDYIVHAGGQIGDYTGTNSYEALVSSYMMGCHFIELDMNSTSDGVLVCVHDWDTDYFRMGKPVGQALSYNEFQRARVLREYTPLTLEKLARWLSARPNVYIITDIKENNLEGLKYISDKYGYIKNQFIPQIYSEGEYSYVKDMGYENIIYTLYALDYNQKTDTEEIVRFANENKLLGITFSSELATDDYIKELKKAGVKLFTHTVNSKSEMERLKEMGIDGIYSDYIPTKLMP